MAVRVLGINIHRMRGSTNRQHIFLWLIQEQEDIFFLQKTYLSCAEDAQPIENLWSGNAYFSYGSKHSRGVGVGILIKKSLNCTVSKVSSDNEGQWINVPFYMENSRLQLMNIMLHVQLVKSCIL